MCNSVLPPAQTALGQSSASGAVSLTTSPSTTLPATIGGTCGLICLFPTPEDQEGQTVQVSGVAVVNPETNEPYECFGRFEEDRRSRRAARRVLRSLSLPVPRRRLDICAFAARVTGPIPEGAPAEIRWQVALVHCAREGITSAGLPVEFGSPLFKKTGIVFGNLAYYSKAAADFAGSVWADKQSHLSSSTPDSDPRHIRSGPPATARCRRRS